MSLTTLLSKPCTIIAKSPSDEVSRFGNVLYDETETATVCELQQRRREEPEDAGELSVTVWDLFLPIGTVLHTDDTVVVDGLEYEVTGEPWDARTGSATVWHVEATVVRARGADDEAGS